MMRHFLLCILVVGLYTASLFAGCPHCYEFKRVEIELHDGSTVQGYLAAYGAWNEVKDSTTSDVYLDLESGDKLGWTPFEVTLYDSLYPVKQHGVVVCTDDIRTLPYDSVNRTRILGHFGRGGAGSVPAYSRHKIQILQTPSLAVYKTEADLRTISLFSYSSEVDSSDLAALGSMLYRRTDAFYRSVNLLNNAANMQKHKKGDWVSYSRDSLPKYFQAEADWCVRVNRLASLKQVALLEILVEDMKPFCGMTQALSEFLQGGDKAKFIERMTEYSKPADPRDWRTVIEPAWVHRDSLTYLTTLARYVYQDKWIDRRFDLEELEKLGVYYISTGFD